MCFRVTKEKLLRFPCMYPDSLFPCNSNSRIPIIHSTFSLFLKLDLWFLILVTKKFDKIQKDLANMFSVST